MLKIRPTSASWLPVRLMYLGFGVATFLILYSVGASIPLAREDAEAIAQQILERTQNIDQARIFINNAGIVLGMFVPGFGAALGAYSAISTGMTFNALVTVTPALEGMSPLAPIATSFGVLEVLAYGLAMSRSGILVYDLAKRKPWRQFVYATGVEMAFVIVVLLLGAVIEGQAIDAASQ